MATAAISNVYPFARDQRFFVRMSIGMAVFVVFAFAQWALRGFVSPATVPIWVHLHGVAMLAWLALFVAQNLLADMSNVALHRKLGWLGFLNGTGMIISGIIQGSTGFSGTAMDWSMTTSIVLLIWIFIVSIFMWRLVPVLAE